MLKFLVLQCQQMRLETMKYNSDIIIIGAGAAGMMAAITAARAGASVQILEHMDMAGKKILATGNGKCNYTNEKQGVEYYYGDNPAFVLPVFEQFGKAETLEFFLGLGILPKKERDCYYPASKQAASMREVLLMELARLQVPVTYNCGIRSVKRETDGFCIETKGGNLYSRFCILATGGCTSKKTGSDGSGFLYLRSLGHHIIDPVPALVGLTGKQPFFKELAGIRIEGKVTVYIDGKPVADETGELQLTDYGISGIPVFQVSRLALRALQEQKQVRAELNLAPHFSEAELKEHLRRCYSQKSKTAGQALIGTFPAKLIPVLLRQAGISEKALAEKTDNEALKRLQQQILAFRVDVTGTKSFDAAQVTAGGVDTAEITNETLESKLVQGLYFAGEMIDIDGKCGGYNLQWAWSSGYAAGIHAAQAAKEKK